MKEEDKELKDYLLSLFPKELNYLFIDDLIHVSEVAVSGTYTFPEESPYYRGHFPGFPVTPGSILMECAVQIGTVVLGKFILHLAGFDIIKTHILLISSKINFKNMVKPNDQIRVDGNLVVYKKSLGILRTKVRMFNNKTEELICTANFTCKVMNDEEFRR